MNVLTDVTLSPYTTLRIGGPAQYFVECHTIEHVRDALAFARSKKCPVFILGGGSNVIIDDRGFAGLVIKISLKGLDVTTDGLLTAAAGEVWDKVVEHSCRQGLAGIEALSGIPGTAGATPIQNVGAYGQEVSQTVFDVQALHRDTFELKTFANHECLFNYRSSLFKSVHNNPWIITQVVFKLSPTREPRAAYDELAAAVTADLRWAQSPRTEKLNLIREQVLKIRARKGMVLDPTDPDTRSVGSFFTNPILPTTFKDLLLEKTQRRGLKRPEVYSAGDNLWKISAAWLIENSGFKKGQCFRFARISTKHILALTNPERASSQDVLDLANSIKDEVLQVFGVRLQEEPVILNKNF